MELSKFTNGDKKAIVERSEYNYTIVYYLNEKIIKKEVTATWNMDTDASFTVNHGLSDHLKIRSVDVMVKSNTGAVFAPLLADGGVSVIDDTVINLTRVGAGGFDNSNFNAATIYVTIGYNL
jgi:hypothetical protein